jgi:hypothetical protein
MAFTQGDPLPSIRTTQASTTTAPSWYTNYLSNLASQGASAGQQAQFAGPTALQNQAFNAVGQNVGSYQPSLNAATSLAQGLAGTNVAQNVSQYMTPYTQNVVDALGQLGRRNIEQVLAPQATAGAVGSGQFGSKRGAEVLGRTINEGLQNIGAQQSQALQTGYGQALGAAQQDYAQKLATSQQLGNLASQRQAMGMADVNALSTLGGQQQQINQAEQMFPLQTLTAQSALLRGFNVPTSTEGSYYGPIPGAYNLSPLQQIGGIASLLAATTGSKDKPSGILGDIYGGLSDWWKSSSSTPSSGYYSNSYGNSPGYSGGYTEGI